MPSAAGGVEGVSQAQNLATQKQVSVGGHGSLSFLACVFCEVGIAEETEMFVVKFESRY